VHGYLLRFGRDAADRFCQLKQSRHHNQKPSQKHEHKSARMLHH
jgi:hypothetical protein